MHNHHDNKSIWHSYGLFWTGFLIGTACFLITYGIRILNVTYDSWIMSLPDPDIRQHYLGFCSYIKSAWQFPAGMTDALSYPFSMSIVWTDSIPVLCIVFKLIRGILPETFQFFGWFGLISFSLMGGFSALLIKRLTGSHLISIMSVPFFVLAFPVLQRMYYHTSLASQWLIVLALLIWLDDGAYRSLRSRCIIWGISGLGCVLIHSYFLPMVGIIILAECLECQIHTHRLSSFVPLLSYCISAIFMLWFLGAFASNVNSSDYAIGGFNANLNTFFNSLGDGILPALSMKYGTQYEGFGYLGLGMLLLSAAAFIICISYLCKKHISVISCLKSHIHASLIAVIFMIYIITATFPELDLGNITLIPDVIPANIKVMFGVFRSNGRFIWPAMYIIMISSVTIISRLRIKNSKAIPAVITAVCLIIQLADLYPYIKEKHSILNENYSYISFLDVQELNAVLPNYDHIVLTFDNNDTDMGCAYYAMRHGLTLNRFYFARNIDYLTNKRLDIYLSYARLGSPEDDCLYILNSDTVDSWKDTPLNLYVLGDKILGSVQIIPGLEEYK